MLSWIWRPCVILTLLAWCELATPLWSGQFSTLVVFGDSHSDLGNACTLLVPKDPDCIGLKYSNGALWIEELADKLELPAPAASVTGGLNFAFGGARSGIGIDRADGFPNDRIPRIGTQVADYLELHTPVSDQLFVVFAGHNDWNWNLNSRPELVAQNMAAHIATLAEAGARHFVVPNLTPLGHAPYLRGSASGASINSAISKYNGLLSRELQKLRDEHPIEIFEVDFAGIAAEAIRDPASVGLRNVTGQARNAPAASRDQYLYWDHIDFAAGFHRVLGQAAFAAVVPEPSGFLLLGLAFAGLMTNLRRRNGRK